MKTILIDTLARDHILVSTTRTSNYANYATILLANYGIKVDKPSMLNKEMMETIDRLFRLRIPSSFYDNPQDLKYYTCSELLVEQLVSYFLVETGTGIYDRVDIFKKDLPKYIDGDEIKLRQFFIKTEAEACEILKEKSKNFCAYTRPWDLDANRVALALYDEGFMTINDNILCKDNIITMLQKDVNFAKQMDRKDVVKLSIQLYGEQKEISKELRSNTIIPQIINLVKPCPLTKKQVKYYNKLVSIFGGKKGEHNSPYIDAIKFFKQGNIVAAADVFAKSGSLLDRNLKMLLSRVNDTTTATEIINKINVKNPIVLYQMLTTLSQDKEGPRTFNFIANNTMKSHTETEYETTWRKSRLSTATKDIIQDVCKTKICDYYRRLPSLGKVYISDQFNKIAMPTNTSAGGSGIDVAPTGSRAPIRGKHIRAFVYWNDIHDVDLSCLLVDKEGKISTRNWRNYSSKLEGSNLLFSGDCRDDKGSEFFDFNLDGLKEVGYQYAVLCINGYADAFNKGEAYCGYQNKDNLETKAWSAKNIESQFRILGDSQACIGFAIDLTTNEMITLNIMLDSVDMVVSKDYTQRIGRYLAPEYLSFINMATLLACRGEVVDSPEKADVVFDDEYISKTQRVIRSYQADQLIAALA